MSMLGCCACVYFKAIRWKMALPPARLVGPPVIRSLTKAVAGPNYKGTDVAGIARHRYRHRLGDDLIRVIVQIMRESRRRLSGRDLWPPNPASSKQQKLSSYWVRGRRPPPPPASSSTGLLSWRARDLARSQINIDSTSVGGGRGRVGEGERLWRPVGCAVTEKPRPKMEHCEVAP